MMLLTLLFFFSLAPQDLFTSFQYCRENSRGPFEVQCVHLDAGGSGEARFKRRESDEVRADLKLSAASRDRFHSVLAGTKFLADAAKYESNRRVADLGKKILTLDLPDGRRQAEFNYSDLKEVNALVQFFDGLLNQQTVVFDLEMAIQYERLSVPRRLEQLENELRANRIADPAGLIGVLEKVEQDSRIVNYARAHARRLRERVSN